MAHINPAIQAAHQNTASPLKTLVQLAKGAKDPMSWLQTMCISNPQLKPLAECIKASGGDAKTAFYKMAEQNGIDPDGILQEVQELMK